MEVNNNKTTSIRYLGELDTKALKTKVSSLSKERWDTSEDFKANYNKKSTSVLNTTKHIILKFSNKQENPFRYFVCSPWKEFTPLVLPLLEQATQSYNYKRGVYTRIMLANLPPRCFIPPHTDGNETGSIPHKIHIPIQTNENSFFFIENERFMLEEGKAYEVNNSVKHSVVNNGKTDRIHLIFEYLDYHQQSDIIKKQIDKQELTIMS